MCLLVHIVHNAVGTSGILTTCHTSQQFKLALAAFANLCANLEWKPCTQHSNQYGSRQVLEHLIQLTEKTVKYNIYKQAV